MRENDDPVEVPPVTVVMPVWREASRIGASLGALQSLRSIGWQVIVVDAGSDDGTAALAEPLSDRVVFAKRGRARQMNAGADLASGEILLFLHADTQLPGNAGERLQAFAKTAKAWGRFDVRLSGQRPLFRLIAALMNLRSRLTGIATGDQALFVRHSVFEALGGFKDIPLMEDVELCQRLRPVGRPWCIRTPVVTDSRRWEIHGPWRTIWLMWQLRWRYWRGESPESLAASYRSDVRHTNGSD